MTRLQREGALQRKTWSHFGARGSRGGASHENVLKHPERHESYTRCCFRFLDGVPPPAQAPSGAGARAAAGCGRRPRPPRAGSPRAPPRVHRGDPFPRARGDTCSKRAYSHHNVCAAMVMLLEVSWTLSPTMFLPPSRSTRPVNLPKAKNQ